MTTAATSPKDTSSVFGFLTKKAESGHLPDAAIRLGIRRLLKARLRELQKSESEQTLQQFIAETVDQPIAVVPQTANEQHYEVPSEFFRRVLGPNLKYSSCYWPDGVTTLEAAERAALQLTCQNAGLTDGMKILELGCGWGSLSLWMADKFRASQVTSVSNSHSQRQFIQQRAKQMGLTNLTVITADMNDFSTDETFDRVLSVEMFEHMRNHGELSRRIHQWLRPDGRLFVHIFCHRTSPYLFEADGEENWMGRHFFTGGMMPSVDLLPQSCESLSLVNQWKWSGVHYAKTCRAWLQNQDAAKEQLMPLFRETYGDDDAVRWHNRWRLFFMACEELFAFNDGDEWFVSHYLFQR